MQFKCRDSTVCVTLESTCDDVIDCPFGDDEYFCGMFKRQCPKECCDCDIFMTKMFPSRQISFARGEITPHKTSYYSAGTGMMNMLMVQKYLEGVIQHFYGRKSFS